MNRLTLLLPIPLVLLLLGVARYRAERAPDVLWPVPAFTLIDQDSAPFSHTQLQGRVWLASFVYTNCPDVCPLVTHRMAALRDSLQRENRLRDVGFLSFSVDPLRDTPAVLRAYAMQFRATTPDWIFLTGPLDTIIPLVTEGFRLTAMHPGRHDPHEAGQQHDTEPRNEAEHQHDTQHSHTGLASEYIVTHTDRIVLFDRAGQVRGTYESSDPDALGRLRRDLRSLW